MSPDEIKKLQEMREDLLVVEVKFAAILKEIKADIDKIGFIRSKIFSLLNSNRLNEED